MGKNYFFQKISILFVFLIGLMNINAQNLSVDQIDLTNGYSRQVVSSGNVSFPAAGQSASSLSFRITNKGVSVVLLTGTPVVQISGTNAAEFTCLQPALSTLNPGQSTTFTITYLPTGLGLKTAQLQIPNDASGIAFEINLKGASFDLYGPKSTVPDGSATVDATDGSNGKFGRAGGGNLYVSAVTFGMQTNLYWGPNLSSTGDLGIKVSMNDDGVYQNDETLTFSSANSNLSIGKLVWYGSTTIQNAITSTLNPVSIRATMTASWFNGTTYTPATLIDPVSLGLSSQIGGLVQFDQLTDYLVANVLIEASTNNGLTWTPYLTFYDNYPTPIGPIPGAGIGKAYSSFSPAFYWENLDPSLTQNSTLVLNEGSAAAITTAKLNAKDLEDLTLAYGNKGNIVFKVTTDNNGLATNFGRGTLKLNGVTLAKNDTFTLQDIEDGRLTYTHDGSETNYDEFLFSFYDSKKELGEDGGYTVYNFKINVLPVNDSPIANNLSFNSSYAQPLNETLTVSDSDSSTFTFTIVSNPTSGTITNFNAATGTFTYTSTLGAPGTDSFTYQVSDGNSTSAVRTVTINIINLPPTSQNEALVTQEDKPLTGTLTGIDPENTAISFQIDKQPTQGTLVLNAGGNFTYTPNPSRFGYDSFLFSARDQEGNTSTSSYKAIINIIPKIDPGDVLVVDKTLVRLYDPVTVQDTIITKNQGLQDALNIVYKKNVGLFAYDKNNGLIKIDPITGIQSLVSPASNFTSAPPIGGPAGMIINTNNKILVADASRILEVDPTNGNVTVLFSGGNINFLTGIVLLNNGDLIATDASKITGGTSKLIRITPQGIQSIITSANLMNLPLDLALINDNKIVIADAGSFAGMTDNIYTIDLTTGAQTILSTGGDISIPSGLDYWKDNVFVVNKNGLKKVVKIDGTTGIQSVVVSANSLTNPWGLFVVQNGITIENLQLTDASCPNAQDGIINFTINGGTAPYYYTLDGGTEVEILSLPVNIANLNAKNYTLAIRDSAGDDTSMNVVVNAVPDTQIPVITSPQTVSVSADNGSCVATNVTLGTPTATDNCTGFTVTNDAPTSFPIGTTVVTWTITDSSNNKATATQNVTVADTQIPVITAPQTVSVSADNGSCVATNVTLGTPTATDNCTGFTVTNNAPTSFPIGTTVVTWTITDSSNNKATATQNVTVADTQIPVITAPQTVSVSADNGSCVATNVTLGTPTATDNCTGFTVTNNAPTSFPIGTTVVTWTITDASGNKATATQNVTVADTQIPVITAPQTVLVSANIGSCVATNVTLGTPTATDNCTGFTVTNNAPTSFPIGTTVVIWTVTDAYGNKATANQNITITDTQIPVISAPQTVSVSADNGSCVATNVTLGIPTATDNCTGFTVTNNAPTSFPIGTTVVTWTITDTSGNKATANQNIRVTDTQNPVITAPQNVTVSPDNGSCVATNVILGTPTATDNCTGFTIINNAPASFPIGTTAVTWTITDASGNKATATQTITVNDLIAPNVPVSQNFCKGALVSDLATNGFNVIWYSSQTVTISLPKTIMLSDGIYYASNFNGTCESKTRTAVTVKINTTAAPTGTTNQQFCDGARLTDIVVNGTNVKWYSSKTSTNALPLTTLLKNQTKYYASQTDNATGCESEQRLEIAVIVKTVVAPQGQQTYVFCTESNSKLLEINKNYSNVVWYDSNSRTNRLNDEYEFTNGDIIYGVGVDSQTGCESTENLTVSIQILNCELEIFNYITPDNNNQNEALVISNIEAFPKNNLQVFNRQGKPVFKVSGYAQDNKSFTGRSNINGETGKLPTGTYFYVLEYFSPVTSKSEIKKGFLYINNND